MKRPKKIIRLNILSDKRGDYIPMCSFPHHPGAIRESYEPTCVSRNCRYYKRVYIHGEFQGERPAQR